MAVSLCPDAMNDPYHHVATKGQKKRIRDMDVEAHDHYLFLWAASKNCGRCVRYWLHYGADVHRGQQSDPSGTALSWAKHEKAMEVVGILEEFLETGLVEEEMHREEENSVRSVSADESTDSFRLKKYFPDDDIRRLWHAAMTGNYSEVYRMIFLEGTNIHIIPEDKELPERMFYWNLSEFVKFAILFWHQDFERCENLTEVCHLLEEAELQRCNDTTRYYKDFEKEHDAEIFQEWTEGLLRSKKEQVEENDMMEFWYAFKSETDKDAVKRFLGPEGWYKFDPFATALDIGFVCPDYCSTWKLRNWINLIGGDLEAVQNMEQELLSENVTGWNCWTLHQQKLVALLLCEQEELCVQWMSDE